MSHVDKLAELKESHYKQIEKENVKHEKALTLAKQNLKEKWQSTYDA